MRRKLIGMIIGGWLMATGAMAAEVVIRVAPPRAVVERRVAAPGRGYVWVGGYHRWDGRGYVWTPGRWELPPRPRARWVEHRYVRRGGGWVYQEGHWR